MKSRLNYKSRKTIIITAIIIALLAISATGIYMFTKGNDEAKAFTEGNTMVEGSESPVVIPEQGNTPEEPTVEPNIGSENNGEQVVEPGATTPDQGTTTTQPGTTTPAGTTTSTTATNVPNQEYVTERQEEVERLTAENFQVSWNPVSLAAIASNIELDKDTNPEDLASYTVKKVATEINGETINRNENGEITTRVKEDDVVTYVITVTNTGNVTLKDITVVDELVKDENGNSYTTKIDVLPIGYSKNVTVKYTVKKSDMTNNDTIINTVKVYIPENPEKPVEDKEEIPADPCNITVSGTKTWVDHNNQEKTRPESITVEVLNGETVVDSKEVRPDTNGNWTYKSKELPKYSDEDATQEITYTVKEANVDSKYNAKVSEDGTTIVNTLTDEYEETLTKTVSGRKTWEDHNNQEKTRPESITVEILNGNTVVDSKEVRPDAKGEWTYTSKALPKYADKNATEEITYTVKEVNVNSKYDSKVSEDGTTIVNTLTDEYEETLTKTVSGRKIWEDHDNKEKTRPESITVEILNGKTVVDSKEVRPNEKGEWTYTSKALPKYADKNATEEITYTVKEVNVNSKYDSKVSEDGTTIVNTLTDEYEETLTKTVSGRKTWEDHDNKEKTRPESITVEILNGKTVVDSKEVRPNEKGEWTYTSKALPKYADKNATEEITYTVKEVNVNSKYDSKVSEDGTTIVNTLTDEYEKTLTKTVSGRKTWEDHDNKEKTRPESITVEILNGKTVVDSKEVRPNEKGEWTYTSKALPKYADKNATEEITYTVKEVNVNSKYDSKVSEDGTTIVNTLTDEYEKTLTKTVSGRKTWEDHDNKEKTRPESITVEILNGKTVVDSKEVRPNAKGEWTYTSKALPKYADKNATEEITYTVKEVNVNSKYDSKVSEDGTTIVNTLTDEYEKTLTKTVSGRKTWEDHNNKEKTRPESITVEILNGKTVVDSKEVRPNEKGEWTYTSKALPKYADKNATEEITYTVKEVNVNSKYDSKVSEDGTTIVNTLTDEYEKTLTKTVSGRKTWEDHDNKEKTRPESITVEILNGKTVVDSKEVRPNAKGEWTYTSKALPKYADKNATEEITYTVKEVNVNSKYDSKVSEDGTTIVNTLTDEYEKTLTKTVSGRKTWEDHNNKEKTRPESITVEILNGKTVVDSKEVRPNAKGEWTYTSKALPKYADKNATEEITYTVKEVNVNAKYDSKVSEDGTTIVNTLTDEYEKTLTKTVSGRKTWVDYDNQEKTRPESITVEILNGNTVVDRQEVKPNAKGEWTYTSKELPKYADKNATQEITYTVRELNVDGKTPVADNGNFGEKYVTTYQGYGITNTLNYIPKTEVTVSKIWEDKNNQDKNRMPSVKIQLYTKIGENIKAEGPAFDLSETTATKVAKNENGDDYWQHKYPDLAKYDSDGNIINYTVKELDSSNKAIEMDKTAEDGTKYGENGAYKVFYDYSNLIENNMITITNKYTPAKVNGNGEIEVKKIWNDNNNQLGKRKEITIQLLADGNEVPGKTLTLNGTKVTDKFTGLDKYKNKGEEITYTVQEVSVPAGYSATYGGSVKDGLTITNTLQKAKVSVEKTATDKVDANRDITYTITLTNSGDTTGNVKVVDTLPEGVTLKENTLTDEGSYNATTRTITWSAVSVPTSGKTLVFTATANGNQIGETVINNVEISSNNAITEISKKSDNAETLIKEKQVIVEEMLEGKKQTTGSNIVLVLDLSSSMNYSTDNDIQQTATYEKRRLTAAKNAINTFISDFYANGQNKTSTISVVTFNLSASVIRVGRNNYATSNNYNDLITAVTNIDIGEASSGYGTYMIPAFNKTYDAIYGNNGLSGKYNSNQNVVMFLTDGEPSDETGFIFTRTDYSGVESAAKNITDKGAKLYSIGFGPTYETTPNPVEENTPYWLLKTISTDKTVHKATDADDLVKQFKDIEASSNAKTTLTTGTFKGQEIANGVLKIQMSKALKIDENNHLTIKHGNNVIVDCTSKEQLSANSITYNENDNTLTWDLNEFIANSETIDALDDSLELVYYIPLN